MNSVLSGFSRGRGKLGYAHPQGAVRMFAFDRSALAVAAPLALLLAVAWWSNRAAPPAGAAPAAKAQAVAASLPSR